MALCLAVNCRAHKQLQVALHRHVYLQSVIKLLKEGHLLLVCDYLQALHMYTAQACALARCRSSESRLSATGWQHWLEGGRAWPRAAHLGRCFQQSTARPYNHRIQAKPHSKQVTAAARSACCCGCVTAGSAAPLCLLSHSSTMHAFTGCLQLSNAFAMCLSLCTQAASRKPHQQSARSGICSYAPAQPRCPGLPAGALKPVPWGTCKA